MTLEHVEAFVRDRAIAFFLCSFVEMSGAPKAKLVPATHLQDMAEGSAGFASVAVKRDRSGRNSIISPGVSSPSVC
jgi:glutamate---methylamine ligase